MENRDKEGYTFAGANAYRVNEIVSVKELFNTLNEEYNETVAEFYKRMNIGKIAV